MRLKSVQLTNVKGFSDSGLIEFSEGINVLVGANNAGKSTILRSIHLLQPTGETNKFFEGSTRVGAQTREVTLELNEPTKERINVPADWDIKLWKPKISFHNKKGNASATITMPNGQIGSIPTNPVCAPNEPNNFIYPYFSRRKPAEFHLQINATNAKAVGDAFQHLPSKIDRLLEDSDSEIYKSFRKACQKILKLKISCTQHGAGKHAGLILQDGTLLPIDSMGEGILHILAFLAHLCVASGKLFLIEEIENDLHPKALKCLLEFIIEKSESNQFIVTTHNNIVVRHLGGAPKSKVFSVEMKLEEPSKIPLCTCTTVSDDPDSRIQLLENLGYDVFDSYLWKGYLILEESTAERVIRDFLIPHFYPSLVTRLRTVAASGVQDVEPRLIDFLRVFVFVHTSPAYKERAWVAVDGDAKGKQLIGNLRSKFSKDWPESHFRHFSADHFEDYYPQLFKQKASEALEMEHGPAKQKAKGNLADEVVNWALAHPGQAKAEFQNCAKDILEFLKEIQAKLD